MIDAYTPFIATYIYIYIRIPIFKQTSYVEGFPKLLKWCSIIASS